MTASVVEVLEAQHRVVVDLFARVASPDADRPAVLHTLLHTLAARVAAERATVEPVVGRRHIGVGLRRALHEDYERIENLMVHIERRKFNSPDIPDLVSELEEAVNRHWERSERELFPGLREKLSLDEQAELGRLVDGEGRIIASHAHPHLLSLGPLADVATRMAGRWDRARDRTAVNRQHLEDDDKVHITRAAQKWADVRARRTAESAPAGIGPWEGRPDPRLPKGLYKGKP